MLGPLAFAIATGEAAAGAYLYSACLTTFAGFAAYVACAGGRKAADLREALLFIFLWWSVAPLFAALPFALAGFDGFDAYFEAVSALTTTGAWLSQEALLASNAGLLWRAELQWMGGLASLSIAAAVFIRPEFIGVDTLSPPFSRGDRASHLRPIGDAAAAFSGAYAAVTAAAIAVLMLGGLDMFEASVLSLSAVASGGLLPRPEGLAAYPPVIAAGLFPFMLLSGANFVLIARLFRGRTRAWDLETRAYLMIAFCVGVMFWIVTGAGDFDRIFGEIFNAVSFLTTSGVVLGAPPPLTVAMITAIIGGAAVSTAGGFKILRWLVIMRRANEEISRLIDPSAVFRRSTVAYELAVWMHFLVFTITLASLLLAIAAGGHSFEIAAATATAILSNTGPLLGLAEGASEGYSMFDGPLRFCLIIGMILGRLEAVAALALINRAFWRS